MPRRIARRSDARMSTSAREKATWRANTALARIPEGSDYRPDPKSRTAREIAWQIVCEEKMIIEALETGAAEWAPPPMPATMKEVLAAECHAYVSVNLNTLSRRMRTRMSGGVGGK